MALISVTQLSNNQTVYISEAGFGFAKKNNNNTTVIFYKRAGVHRKLRVNETMGELAEKSDKFLLLDGGNTLLDVEKIDSASENQPSGSIIFYNYQGKIFTISDSISSLFEDSTVTDFKFSKEITSNYTISSGDFNKILVCNSASDITITLDAEANSNIPINSEIEIFRQGQSAVSVTSASGVSINNSAQSTESLSNQYDGLCIKQISSDSWFTIRRNCCGAAPTFSFGNALYFRNQNNTSVSIPSYSIDTSSISMWFYLPSGVNAYFLFGRDDSSLGYIQVNAAATPNEIICTAGTSPTSATFIPPISSLRSNWNHMVIVRDGTNMNIYINGTVCSQYKVGSGSLQSTPAPIGVISTNVIGGYNGIELTGWLNEIAIWDSAITAQNVTDLYNGGDGQIAGEVVASPVRYYRFNLDANGNEQTGTTLIDLGSSGSDGTLVNFSTPSDWVDYTTANG